MTQLFFNRLTTLNNSRHHRKVLPSPKRAEPRSASPLKRLVLLLALCSTASSFARVYIDISGATVRKAKLAVGELHPLKGSRTATAAELKELESEIRDDLKFTDLFDLMDRSVFSHLDTPEYLYKIRYQEWGLTGASFVIKFGYRIVGSKLSLEVFLYDIPGRAKVFSTRYEYAVNKYYQLVHAMSDDVLKEITGEKGLFKSRILMVCRDTNRRNANKEIYLVNPDGRELTQVTRDNTLTVGPAWGPGGNSISLHAVQTSTREKQDGTYRTTDHTGIDASLFEEWPSSGTFRTERDEQRRRVGPNETSWPSRFRIQVGRRFISSMPAVRRTGSAKPGHETA
ncbi:MAG: hypothetical protein R3B54_09485 [Bdellovibrionota bacterium]